MFKERLFFVADDGKHGTELYQTDGTAAGTSLVKDINPEGNSHAQGLVVYKGQLYFGADDGKHGRLVLRIHRQGELRELGALCNATNHGVTPIKSGRQNKRLQVTQNTDKL